MSVRPRTACSRNRGTISRPSGSSIAPWALTLLSRAFDRLAEDYAASGRGVLFERLQGMLAGGSAAVPCAKIAAELQMTEPAVQQAASRLRKRYRQALRDEIAATLSDPQEADINAEIQDLHGALGG